jgi:gamma-glutamyltranspeptidase / glutathione hydrolase
MSPFRLPRRRRWMNTPAGVRFLLLAVFLGGCSGPQDRAQDPATDAAGEISPVSIAIRPEVSGLHGAVVAGHPLAAAAGYEVLRAGGNAADAAVTMAAVLAVVRPHMNGVGGDAFALFLDAREGEVRALNASGRAAALAEPEWFLAQGRESMPGSGPLSVTVPGAVSAWAATLQRYGTLSLARALEPAIRLAEEGFVVTATLAEDLEGATRLNAAGQELYAPGGAPLTAGQVLRNPALGRTLRTLASQGPAALYGGEIGEALAAFLEAEGSPLRIQDFADHTADWEAPVALEFMGRRVHTTGPGSQGFVLLQMLGILESLGPGGMGLDGAGEAGGSPDPAASLSPGVLHALVEAKKLAFADRDRWLADPSHAPVPMDRLLDRGYLGDRAALVGSEAAEERNAGFGDPLDEGSPADGNGDTVYLMAVDADGNAVSWIQSLFASFGSGLVEPTTGIVLQNRGAGFTLQDGHPNQVAPGKRPFHTLMATLVTDAAGAFEFAIGTPGGHGQPQTVAQGIVHLLLSERSPQEAVEAPRFRSEDGRVVLIEDRYPAAFRDALAARGHELRVREGWTAPFGNLQVIRRTPEGVLRTGADMRREGAALAY